MHQTLFKSRFYLLLLISFFLTACGGGDTNEVDPLPAPAPNLLPTVDAGNDISADEQSLVTLSATGSDSDGSIASYAWTQTSGPSVTLDATNTASVTFTSADITQNIELVFEVVVTDNDGATASDTVTVNINRVNQLPVAVAGDDQTVTTGTLVTVNGSSSSDPDADALTYAWTIELPDGSSSTLANADMQEATFTPDVAGEYTVSLVVNDGEASSTSSSLTVTASAPAPLVTADVRGTVLTFNSNNTLEQGESDEVTVLVSLLDENDNIVATDSPEAIFNQAQATELRFTSEISGPGAMAVSVSVSRDGYTSFSRRLDLTDVTRVEAKISEVVLEEVMPSTMSSVSGESTIGFNVDMLSDEGAGGISIGIPSSLMPDDVNSLMVAVETFDPNDPNDAELFPGEYEDSSGQALVSVAFNFAEIMTDSGESVVSAMNRKRDLNYRYLTSDERKLAEEDEDPVIINRNIPASSCPILNSLGDSDTDEEGFQIPVYTYNPNTGLWDLLGQGSVYDNAGNLQSADKNDFDCTNEKYVLEILVTNDIFLSDWWNLDYPLVFDEPTALCANIEVQNEEQQILSNTYGFVSDKDDTFNFSSGYFVTDDMGRANIEVIALNGSQDTTADLFFYSAVEFGFTTTEINLSSDCDNPPLQVVTVNRPKLCTVSGRSVYVDGEPAGGNLIYGFGISDQGYTYDFVNADENGEFSLNLQCDIDVQVFDYITLVGNAQDDIDIEDYTRSANVNGGLELDEVSDDGDTVVITDFEVDYLQPLVYVIPILQGQISVSVLAVESSFPVQLAISFENDDGSQVLGNLSATAVPTEDEESQIWFYVISTQTIDYVIPDGTTSFTVTITDETGNVWEQARQPIFAQ